MVAQPHGPSKECCAVLGPWPSGRPQPCWLRADLAPAEPGPGRRPQSQRRPGAACLLWFLFPRQYPNHLHFSSFLKEEKIQFARQELSSVRFTKLVVECRLFVQRSWTKQELRGPRPACWVIRVGPCGWGPGGRVPLLPLPTRGGQERSGGAGCAPQRPSAPSRSVLTSSCVNYADPFFSN